MHENLEGPNTHKKGLCVVALQQKNYFLFAAARVLDQLAIGCLESNAYVPSMQS